MRQEAVKKAQTRRQTHRADSGAVEHSLRHFGQAASLSGPRCPQLQSGENKALPQRLHDMLGPSHSVLSGTWLATQQMLLGQSTERF